MRNTGYVWHTRYAWHDTGTHAGVLSAGGMVQPYHNFESPESKERMAGLVEVSGLLDRLTRVQPRVATEEELLPRVEQVMPLDPLERITYKIALKRLRDGLLERSRRLSYATAVDEPPLRARPRARGSAVTFGSSACL